MTEHDRRQDIRRDEDKLIEFRVDRLEETVHDHGETMKALGSAIGHLALLDHRSDDNTRRIGALESSQTRIDAALTDIKISLETVRARVMVFSAAGSLIGAGVVALIVKYIGG